MPSSMLQVFPNLMMTFFSPLFYPAVFTVAIAEESLFETMTIHSGIGEKSSNSLHYYFLSTTCNIISPIIKQTLSIMAQMFFSIIMTSLTLFPFSTSMYPCMIVFMVLMLPSSYVKMDPSQHVHGGIRNSSHFWTNPLEGILPVLEVQHITPLYVYQNPSSKLFDNGHHKLGRFISATIPPYMLNSNFRIMVHPCPPPLWCWRFNSSACIGIWKRRGSKWPEG